MFSGSLWHVVKSDIWFHGLYPHLSQAQPALFTAPPVAIKHACLSVCVCMCAIVSSSFLPFSLPWSLESQFKRFYQ